MNTTVITVRLDDDLINFMDELALKLHTNRSEIIRRFLGAGRAANPLPPHERRKLRTLLDRSRRDGRDVDGLVIPQPPADLVARKRRLEKKGIEQPSSSLPRLSRAA